MTPNRLRCASVGVAAACLAWGVAAGAQPADAHAAAGALLTQLQADARAPLAADAIGQAKTALERATRIRVTGDEVHARAADELALEWAQMARDVMKAAEAEAAAGDARKKAVEAHAQLERTRAAVEEGIARVGRLKTELAEVEASHRNKGTAVEVHDGEPAGKKPGTRPPGPRNAGKKPATSSGDAP